MTPSATRIENTTGVASARPRFRAFPWIVAVLILALFIGAPAAGFFSLMKGSFLEAPLTFSPTQLNAIRETGLLLAGVITLAGSMGLVTAWLVAIYDFPYRRLIEVALVLPLALPTYLAAFVAVDLFDFFGPAQRLWRWLIGATSYNDYRFFEMRSLPGAIIVISLVLFPYVYVSCRLLFAHGGRNVIDAARILGARGFSLFFRIGVPLAWPALISGLVLVVLETINDIGATEHLGVSSLSVVIRDLWLNRGDLPAAVRMAGLLVGIVALLIFLDRSHRHRKSSHARNVAQPRAIRLSGASAWFATLATGMPVMLGFLIPTGFLLWRTVLYAGQQTLDSAFFSAALSSIVLALAVSFTVMALGALLTVAIRIAPKLSPAGRIAAFGYAVPGTVLVLAVFPVLRTTDDLLAASGASWALSGTFAAVVFALVVRFIGIGAGQAQLALRRLPASIDWVARVHGMGDLKLAFQVHLPAMMPGLTLGGILVFIDTVKELPATLLLRPLNFETLATRAYAEASAGTFEHAALDSLAILALSGCAALMLARRR